MSTLLWMGCASLDARVRERAAHDFECASERVRILDSTAGVYRVAGCGEVATYQCAESRALTLHCDRVAPAGPVTTTAGSYELTRRQPAPVPAATLANSGP